MKKGDLCPRCVNNETGRLEGIHGGRPSLPVPLFPQKISRRRVICFSENFITVIHKEKADFVCFPGDLVGTSDQLAEALRVIRASDFLVFGILRNRDYASSHSFHPQHHACAAPMESGS